MHTIIDIDQDFFYLPEVYGNNDDDNDKKRFWRKTNQKQVISLPDFFSKYNLNRLPYTIFRDHSQVYWYIKNFYSKIKLIHFDAHYDFFEGEEDFNNGVSIGNWISHLVANDLCDDITWITPDSNWAKTDNRYLTTHYETLFNKEYKTILFDFETFELNDEADEVLFTLSPTFCPPDSKLIQEFIYFMG